MKKLIFVALFLAVGAVASSADAYTLVDGKECFGYCPGGIEMNTIPPAGIVDIPVQTDVLAVGGNTTLIDLMKKLNPEDMPLFIQILHRAHIYFR